MEAETINPINSNNYFNNTIGIFDIVTDNQKISEIENIVPSHVNDRVITGRKWWANYDDYQNYVFFEDLNQEDQEDYKEEIALGILGLVFNYGINDLEDEDDELLTYYILKKGNDHETVLLTNKVQYELTSKAWIIDNVVYRYAKFWGILGTCEWFLNKEKAEDLFVLAKCEISNLSLKK